MLVLILLAGLFLHLPPVQKAITLRTSDYLSQTIGSEVSVRGIHLSVLDGIAVSGLEVDDPEGNNILNLNRLAVMPDLIGLIFGNYHVHYLGLKGFQGRLINSEQGLNIQYIIDAFSSQVQDTTSERQSFSIAFDQISFEDIRFDFISNPEDTDLNLAIGNLEIDQLDLSTAPNKIFASSIGLDQLDLNVLTAMRSTSTEPAGLPPLDFASGFEFEIGSIEFRDNHVSYHFQGPEITTKFDPDHLDLDSIQLDMADIIIREDSLSFELRKLSADLGALGNISLSSLVSAGLNESNISNVHLATGNSQVNLSVAGKYQSWPHLIRDYMSMDLRLSTQGTIDLMDLSYFMPDSLISYAPDWPPVDFELSGQYSSQTTRIETLNLLTGQSKLTATGMVYNIADPDSIWWEQAELAIIAGPEFERLTRSYTSGLHLPEKLEVQLFSHGKPALFEVQTRLTSAVGIADINGSLGIDSQAFNLQDLKISGQKLELGKVLELPWLGSIDFSLEGNGKAGDESDLAVTGRINRVNISGQDVEDIDIRGNYQSDVSEFSIRVNDPRYHLDLQSQLLMGEIYHIKTVLKLAGFNLGRMIEMDSTLLISGNIDSEIDIGGTTLSAAIMGSDILISNDSVTYPIDTIALDTHLAADGSTITLYSDNSKGNLEANFDIREAPELIAGLFENAGQGIVWPPQNDRNRNFTFNLQLDADKPFRTFNQNIDLASDFRLKGLFHEKDQVFEVSANTGKFIGFGFSADSMAAKLQFNQRHIASDLLVDNIHYDTLNLGNLAFHIFSEDSANALSTISLERDSLKLLKTTAQLRLLADKLRVYLDSLVVFNQNLAVSRENPIVLSRQNIEFDRYSIKGADLDVRINGDLQEFELSLDNLDLRGLNPLLSTDSAWIQYGNLNALFAFVKADQKINLQTRIDSLTFQNVPPIYLRARAVTENGQVPITFSLNSATNNIQLTGDYNYESSEITSKTTLELNDLGMFRFLYHDLLEGASGNVDGSIDISGPLNSPRFLGEIRFKDVDITTLYPRTTFHLQDELLTLNNSGIVLNEFILLDQRRNPLKLNGSLFTEDYKNFEYDFTIHADNYMLINNPPEENYQLQGTLVIGSDLNLRGNSNDLEVDAELVIRDTTDITYVMPQQDLELLTDDGIVEFINPMNPSDTLSGSHIQTMHDSVISTLPSFNLNTSIQLEEKAVLRVILDANSGDYIEATGDANLKYTLDRTKNAELIGVYTIKSGFYQLSFYDLVKKTFEITDGSTVRWSGNPNKGELDIKATYTIKTSSVGLIGHEIGESEKELYRRALPYEVGIIIKGDLELPEISFSLDLPQDEKANYPALSNKLSRLQQPEFESELNKQVFGLLVLGGFIPESGGSAFDEQLIATTALSNSVNSILAGQLNRFASHMIKGVDIDVGLQSYSDYSSTGSGQTRTAMDFRVTKRLMDDRLSIEVGGGLDINSENSGAYAGSDNFRGDIAVVYDLTGSGNKQLKIFNNETYDIIYHEIRNTGVSLIFIREFDKKGKQPEP